MSTFQALWLGIIQGLTEFLPISSSGHLVIFQQWFGLSGEVLTFDIFIHLATLLAIIIFFGSSLFKVTLREWLLIAIATVPAVIVGLLFKDEVDALFADDKWVGLELIITGLINFYTDYRLKKVPLVQATGSAPLTPLKSLALGVAQAIAIIPGISRSGSTVAGAVSLGIDREQAFRFSFLMAIPALIGAGVLQFKDVMRSGAVEIELLPFLVGGIAALITGILSLALFRYVIRQAHFEWFGWYCVVAGGLMMIFF